MSVVTFLGSFVDLKMVRSFVEVTLGSLWPQDTQELPIDTEEFPLDSENEVDIENGVARGRSGLVEPGNTEAIKDSITMLVGALIGQQECWEKTACKVSWK